MRTADGVVAPPAALTILLRRQHEWLTRRYCQPRLKSYAAIAAWYCRCPHSNTMRRTGRCSEIRCAIRAELPAAGGVITKRINCALASWRRNGRVPDVLTRLWPTGSASERLQMHSTVVSAKWRSLITEAR